LRAPAPGDTNAGGPAGVSLITVAPSVLASMPTTGDGGTAVLTGVAPRMAASSSCVADARDASDSATLWSSSSAVSARNVIREPAADLTVMLIGASVEDMFLLDSSYNSTTTTYIFFVVGCKLIQYYISAHEIDA
jgi:hypothetical protein